MRNKGCYVIIVNHDETAQTVLSGLGSTLYHTTLVFNVKNIAITNFFLSHTRVRQDVVTS